MASKGNTKTAAAEYLETGNAPEVDVEEQGEGLDETLNEFQEEQEAATEEVEEVEEEQVVEEEAEEAPAKDPKTGKFTKKDAPVEEEQSEEEADGNVAEEDPKALPEEVAALPRVQELVQKEQQIEILSDLLAEGYGYDLTNPEQAFQRLRAERSDAAMLYAMIDGTLPASTLLSQLEDGVKKGVFQQDMVDRVQGSLTDHFATNGSLDKYLGDRGLAVVPQAVVNELLAEAKKHNVDFKVPSIKEAIEQKIKSDPTAALRQEIEALKRQISGGANAKYPATAQPKSNDPDYPDLTPDQVKVQKSADSEIKKFMKEKGVSDDLYPEYQKAVMEMVKSAPGGSTAIIKRIASGNYVDIRRLATSYHNTMVERAQRYAKGVSGNAPKIVKKAGSSSNTGKTGTSTAKPGVKGKKVLTKEDRVNAVLQAFENQ